MDWLMVARSLADADHVAGFTSLVVVVFGNGGGGLEKSIAATFTVDV